MQPDSGVTQALHAFAVPSRTWSPPRTALQRARTGFVVFALLASVPATVPGATPSVAAAQETTERGRAAATDGATALLTRLTPHIEKAYGAAFKRPPRVVVVSRERATEIFRADLRPEIERRYPDASKAQRRTLLNLSASSSVASCLARYSFGAKAIIVVRKSFDSQRETAGFAADEAADLLLAVLAHEAVHALDDERFDLASFYANARDAEALRARAMVVEGRAVHFGRIAAQAAGAGERARGLLPGGEEPRDARAWSLRMTYEAGARFVAGLVRRGGARLADRALTSAPATTHEVFHGERWPESPPDARPAARLRESGLTDRPLTLSELQLRARYAALHGRKISDAIFAGFRGGAQALVDATNVIVLAFADAEAARNYVALAGEEAPTRQASDLVMRAFGPAADALLTKLLAKPDHDE